MFEPWNFMPNSRQVLPGTSRARKQSALVVIANGEGLFLPSWLVEASSVLSHGSGQEGQVNDHWNPSLHCLRY